MPPLNDGSPLLYESYARRHPSKVKSLARVTDTTKTITIILSAGKGVILTANAFDEAGATVTKRAPGQGIGLQVLVRNDGDDDTIWITIKDKDTGRIIIRKDGITCETEAVIPSGKTFPWTAATARDLDMPNKTWNLLIEAGHGK